MMTKFHKNGSLQKQATCIYQTRFFAASQRQFHKSYKESLKKWHERVPVEQNKGNGNSERRTARREMKAAVAAATAATAAWLDAGR